jgi:hypothetical protein
MERGSEDSGQYKKKKGGNLEIFRHVLKTTVLWAVCRTFFANYKEIVKIIISYSQKFTRNKKIIITPSL